MGDPRRERDRRAFQVRRFEALCGIAGTNPPMCRCCGELRVWALTFDHIDGGGHAHRLSAGRAPTVELVRRAWRAANGVWPRGVFQVLCATCNHGRRVDPDGVCPHVREGVNS